MKQTTDKYRLMGAMVRGFFGAFATGIIDCHTTDTSEKNDPKTIKRLMLEHYEEISGVFHDTLFYPIAAMNFSYDQIAAIVSVAAAQKQSMMELVEKACASASLYQAMIAEYRKNFSGLLGGKFVPIAEHLSNYTRNTSPEQESVEMSLAIRLVVRTVMTAYAKGIEHGATGQKSFRQASLLHLMLDAMNALTGDTPVHLGADDNIGEMFLKVCKTEANVKTLADEMDNAYEELAQADRQETPTA